MTYRTSPGLAALYVEVSRNRTHGWIVSNGDVKEPLRMKSNVVFINRSVMKSFIEWMDEMRSTVVH